MAAGPIDFDGRCYCCGDGVVATVSGEALCQTCYDIQRSKEAGKVVRKVSVKEAISDGDK